MVPRDLHDQLVLAPFISEEDMPRLYMRAAAVLYPTLYEGFGLPVVGGVTIPVAAAKSTWSTN